MAIDVRSVGFLPLDEMLVDEMTSHCRELIRRTWSQMVHCENMIANNLLLSYTKCVKKQLRLSKIWGLLVRFSKLNCYFLQATKLMLHLIYICQVVCLSVCLNPVNVQAVGPILTKFGMGA